jgi:hypothetical protein
MVHDIRSDGRTVWINDESGLIGRFGPRGIDIHQTVTNQLASGKECLFCTHEPTNEKDWDTFVLKMKELYSIDVPLEHKPLFLRESLVRTGRTRSDRPNISNKPR